MRYLASSGPGKQQTITSLLVKWKLSDASQQIADDLSSTAETNELPCSGHANASDIASPSPDYQDKYIPDTT